MTGLEFKKQLKKVDLSKKKFSKHTGVNYDTIVGWTKGVKDNVPTWVKSWLENYECKLELLSILNKLNLKK